MECLTMESENQHVFKEGKAEILAPAGPKVFYNPVQEFNRDLSIAVLRVISKSHYANNKESETSENGLKSGVVYENGLNILEALSATGLRSIRYAAEIPGLKQVLANDISKSAVEMIENNIKHNNLSNLVKVSHADASSLMYNNRNYKDRFDAVDLDPYGCPTIFLDGAVQCVKDGGLLLVTCTDMAVLCGNSPNTCYVKYGAVSLKLKSCHEMALRIVLQCIESHANKYKRYIVPLLSISVDFYIRVFVRVFTSAAVCKLTTSKLSYVYQCISCESFTLQPLGVIKTSDTGNKFILPHVPSVDNTCQHCQSKHHMGGPIWSAPIHDLAFVNQLLEEIESSDLGTSRRLQGVLSVVREELLDVPLYHTVDRLCSIVKCNSMSMMVMRSALLNAGYSVSLSHACKNSVKTNAPTKVLWDVIRTWVEKNPVKDSKKNCSNKPRANILSIQSETQVDFSLRRDANPLSREMKLVRFQMNPTSNWGPGMRNTLNFEKPEKRERNQNKKRNRNKSNEEENPKIQKVVKNSEIQELK